MMMTCQPSQASLCRGLSSITILNTLRLQFLRVIQAMAQVGHLRRMALLVVAKLEMTKMKKGQEA